jgi:hypothetical protein
MPTVSFIILTTLVLVAATGQSQTAQNGQVKKPPFAETIEEADENHFPVVDYIAEKRLSGAERKKRDAKGKKYDSRHAAPINEFSNRIFSFIDWERGLSAFPIERSSAVVIGEVIEAEAHLSTDETKIYSESSVRVDEVLKNDQLIFLSPQSRITVERLGGRVRFPSGKIVTAAVSNQDLPRVGRRYVLFLTHDFIMGGRYDDLFILTGYELRGELVLPLDKLPSGHPINTYKGSKTEVFLKDLMSALANASRPVASWLKGQSSFREFRLGGPRAPAQY